MEPFEAYQKFLAVKAHFTTSYDYRKYNGKVKVKFDTFAKSKGKYFFGKLGKKYKSEFPEYVATTYAYLGGIQWVGDLDSEESLIAWETHQKHMQSIRRTFEKDINVLLDVAAKNDFTFKQMFLCKPGELPPVEKLRKIDLITLETCVILNRLLGYTTKIKCTNPLWENIKITIEKFDTFLSLPSNDIFANIIKTKL